MFAQKSESREKTWHDSAQQNAAALRMLYFVMGVLIQSSFLDIYNLICTRKFQYQMLRIQRNRIDLRVSSAVAFICSASALPDPGKPLPIFALASHSAPQPLTFFEHFMARAVSFSSS